MYVPVCLHPEFTDICENLDAMKQKHWALSFIGADRDIYEKYSALTYSIFTPKLSPFEVGSHEIYNIFAPHRTDAN